MGIAPVRRGRRRWGHYLTRARSPTVSSRRSVRKGISPGCPTERSCAPNDQALLLSHYNGKSSDQSASRARQDPTGPKLTREISDTETFTGDIWR